MGDITFWNSYWDVARVWSWYNEDWEVKAW
jgi:hypothetical protein